MLYWLIMLCLSAGHPAQAHSYSIYQTSGPFRAQLKFPGEGVFAGDSTDIFLIVTRRGAAESDSTAPNVMPLSRMTCHITMPQMPGMPAITPAAVEDPYPGKYMLTTSFPHGGLYRVVFTARRTDLTGSQFFKFDLNVQDMNQVNAQRPYLATLHSEPFYPKPGEPVDLTIAVWRLAQLTRFDTFHTKKMHLIIVRSDLGAFFHVHPVLHPDGTFTYRFRFPTPGTWHLFCEVSPTGAGEQTLLATQFVQGDAPQPTQLPTPTCAPVYDAGMKLTLDTHPQTAHRTSTMRLLLSDPAGKPLHDLQPWLAAPAHLTLISQDGFTFIHSHPDSSPEAMAAARKKPGDFDFVVRFPRAGTYKAWLQFQRAGTVYTMPFLMAVQQNAAPHGQPPMSQSDRSTLVQRRNSK
jgi:hypothetical protein